MRCLVTGGAGFIGSNLVEGLLKRGHSVRVLDNLSTGSKTNLASVLSQIDFQEGDLRSEADVARAVQEIEVVFHQGALRSVPRSVDDPASSNEVNVSGTLKLLMAARQAGVRRVVYASSSSVYGDNRVYPQHEGLRVSPLSPYAVSKYAAEAYMAVFAKTFGLETVSLRYFNVFGPRQHPESQYAAVIPKFMESIYRDEPLQVHWDGKQSRDFTYIENVVEANVRAAMASGVSGQVFNIACGDSHSLLAIIREFERITGKSLCRRHLPMRAGDVRKTWADITQAKRLLRYKPAVTLREGLARTWEWFVSTQAQKGG